MVIGGPTQNFARHRDGFAPRVMYTMVAVPDVGRALPKEPLVLGGQPLQVPGRMPVSREASTTRTDAFGSLSRGGRDPLPRCVAVEQIKA